MSLIGPRAEWDKLVEAYEKEIPHYHLRHISKPGITGWAQVNGRNAQSWEERFEHDVWYVDNWSLALDARVLWRTVKVVLGADGVSAEGEATMAPFMGSDEEPR